MHKLYQSVRLKWARKQESKESINFVLVTPQHNIFWVILPSKDSHVPQITKSNRARSPQRDYNTLRSIHAKQRQYRLLYSFKLVITHKHLTDHNITCCQRQERSPLHNLSSCEVSTWFRRPKDNESKLSCQKVLSVQSYRCESPLRITTDQTGIQSNLSRPSWVNKERQSLKYVLYNNHM